MTAVWGVRPVLWATVDTDRLIQWLLCVCWHDILATPCFTWPMVWQLCAVCGQFCGLLWTLTGWFSDCSLYGWHIFILATPCFTWPMVWQLCAVCGQFCGLLWTLTGWFSDCSLYGWHDVIWLTWCYMADIMFYGWHDVIATLCITWPVLW